MYYNYTVSYVSVLVCVCAGGGSAGGGGGNQSLRLIAMRHYRYRPIWGEGGNAKGIGGPGGRGWGWRGSRQYIIFRLTKNITVVNDHVYQDIDHDCRSPTCMYLIHYVYCTHIGPHTHVHAAQYVLFTIINII